MEVEFNGGARCRRGIAVANRAGCAHADRHMVAPSSFAGLHSAVDFEEQFVAVERDFGDLHFVAQASHGAELLLRFLPFFLVVRAVGIVFERLAGTRQYYFSLGVFRRKIAQESDFFVIGELV